MSTENIYLLPPSVYTERYVDLARRIYLEGPSASIIPEGSFGPDGNCFNGPGFENLVASLQIPHKIKALEERQTMYRVMAMLRATPIDGHHSHVSGIFSRGYMCGLLRALLNLGKIFQSYFGFLCIEFFVRTILVGVLSRLEMLDQFIKLAAFDTDKIITRNLAEVVAYELRSTMSPDGHGIDPSGGVALPLHQRGILLPEIGGVEPEDLKFLFNLVWNDRKGFTQVMSSDRHFRYGWSSIFCLVFKVFEREKSTTTGEQWGQLWYLLYRYRLFAPFVDETLTQVLCSEIETRTRFHEFTDFEWTDGPIDKEDARMVVRGYINKMVGPGDEFPSRMTPIQLMRVPYEAMSDMKAYELVGECARATISQAWVDAAALNNLRHDPKYAVDSLQMHVCQIVKHFQRILDLEVDYMSPGQRTSLLKVLEISGLFALIGRALLAHAAYFAATAKVDYGSSRVWRDLVNEIKSLAILFKTRYPTDTLHAIFSPSHCDIQKTLLQNQLILALSGPTSHIYKFARDSKLVLEELMPALGTTTEALRLDPNSAACRSNRCPAADEGPTSVWKKPFVCTGCYVVEYCSRDCQTRDWHAGYPNPHRTECEFLGRFVAEFGVSAL